MYSWLLFDADGTLWDYDKAEAKSLSSAFVQSGIPFETDFGELYRKINGQLWVDFEQGKISQLDLRHERFGRLFSALGIKADAHAFSELYLRNLGNTTDLIDGALELLQALEGRFQMLLITNGIPNVQRSRLSQSPIEPFFEAVIISGEVGVAKPDPAIFDAAFAAMGHPEKKETMIIGDSLSSDIRGGINYGIDTCWYNPWKLPGPDIRSTYEIHALDQLLAFTNH
jgi:2-haloacid dehalogenase